MDMNNKMENKSWTLIMITFITIAIHNKSDYLTKPVSYMRSQVTLRKSIVGLRCIAFWLFGVICEEYGYHMWMAGWQDDNDDNDDGDNDDNDNGGDKPEYNVRAQCPLSVEGEQEVSLEVCWPGSSG